MNCKRMLQILGKERISDKYVQETEEKNFIIGNHCGGIGFVECFCK